MDSTLKTWIDAPAIGLPSCLAEERSMTSPTLAGQGTAVPFGGMYGLPAVRGNAGYRLLAVAAARTTELPGPVPRGAPV